jgi:parallel beta-helix repeat protein
VFNRVIDNHIRHTGVVNKYSTGVFTGLSEGNVIGHNLIHHVPHHAICFGSTGRSRNIFEYNEIRHTCLWTHDTSAIDGWMDDEARDEPRQGHIIRYNLIVDSRKRGIRLDNSASNCFLYGNIIVRARRWGITLHGGKNNIVENNMFISCGGSALFLGGDLGGLMPDMAGFMTGNRFCHNIVCDNEEGVLSGGSWPVKQQRRAIAQSDYNLLFNVPNAKSYLEGRRPDGHETHSQIADPMFVDPENDDYRLKPDSPALQLGFQPIDFARIGIKADSQ